MVLQQYAWACRSSAACFAGLCHLLGLLAIPANCPIAVRLLQNPRPPRICLLTPLLQGETGAMPRLLALTRARVMYCLQNHAALDVAAVVSDELSLLAELAAASSSAAAGQSCCIHQSCCRLEQSWFDEGLLPPEIVHARRYPTPIQRP